MEFKSESEFQREVVKVARDAGWLVMHIPNSYFRWCKVNYIPTLDATGFPDLVLVKGGTVLFRELKLKHSRLGPAQEEWGLHLAGYYKVWRSHQWDEIIKELADA